MGLRAISVRRYEIEYGQTMGFNHDPDTLENLIRDFCSECYFGDDGYSGSSTGSVWEIDKEEYINMLYAIKEMTDNEFRDRLKNHWQVGLSISHDDYSKDYFVSHLEGYLNETPPNDVSVKIAWI